MFPKLSKEFAGYFLVALSGLIIDVGVLYFLTTHTTIWYLLASGISFTLALCSNYFLATNFVFAVRKQNNRPLEFSIFTTIALSALAINQVCIFVLVERFDTAVLISKLITVPITFGWNFCLNKLLLF